MPMATGKIWKALRRAGETGAAMPGAAVDAPARDLWREAAREAVADHDP